MKTNKSKIIHLSESQESIACSLIAKYNPIISESKRTGGSEMRLSKSQRHEIQHWMEQLRRSENEAQGKPIFLPFLEQKETGRLRQGGSVFTSDANAWGSSSRSYPSYSSFSETDDRDAYETKYGNLVQPSFSYALQKQPQYQFPMQYPQPQQHQFPMQYTPPYQQEPQTPMAQYQQPSPYQQYAQLKQPQPQMSSVADQMMRGYLMNQALSMGVGAVQSGLSSGYNAVQNYFSPAPVYGPAPSPVPSNAQTLKPQIPFQPMQSTTTHTPSSSSSWWNSIQSGVGGLMGYGVDAAKWAFNSLYSLGASLANGVWNIAGSAAGAVKTYATALAAGSPMAWGFLAVTATIGVVLYWKSYVQQQKNSMELRAGNLLNKIIAIQSQIQQLELQQSQLPVELQEWITQSKHRLHNLFDLVKVYANSNPNAIIEGFVDVWAELQGMLSQLAATALRLTKLA